MKKRTSSAVVVRSFPPSSHGQPIWILQSPHSRALNVGYIEERNGLLRFVPGRLNFGIQRENDTYEATVQTLKIPVVRKILRRFKPHDISTITVLRETLACRLASALTRVGVHEHYGDAFIGATHIKTDGNIRTAYLYENTEGLTPRGLWVIAESVCVGRNLDATMKSLLDKFHPREILFIAPIGSRRAVNLIGALTAGKKIPTTFVAWGALFGVDEKTLYDMPWGHPDTEPLDTRDYDTVVSMYGKELCTGGDFGNNFYSPLLAKQLYDAQLKEHHIIPKIPQANRVLAAYHRNEILIR